jgi:hypothetical protein
VSEASDTADAAWLLPTPVAGMTSNDDFEVPSDGPGLPRSPSRVIGSQATLEKVDLQGWLKKAPYGNLTVMGMLMLKKRYFVLCGDELAYYSSDADFRLREEPLGKIKICAFSTLTVVDGINQWGVQLKIAGTDNAVYMQAATRETRTLWMDKLRAVVVQKNKVAHIIHAGYLIQHVVSRRMLCQTEAPAAGVAPPTTERHPLNTRASRHVSDGCLHACMHVCALR